MDHRTASPNNVTAASVRLWLGFAYYRLLGLALLHGLVCFYNPSPHLGLVLPILFGLVVGQVSAGACDVADMRNRGPFVGFAAASALTCLWLSWLIYGYLWLGEVLIVPWDLVAAIQHMAEQGIAIGGPISPDAEVEARYSGNFLLTFWGLEVFILPASSVVRAYLKTDY